MKLNALTLYSGLWKRDETRFHERHTWTLILCWLGSLFIFFFPVLIWPLRVCRFVWQPRRILIFLILVIFFPWCVLLLRKFLHSISNFGHDNSDEDLWSFSSAEGSCQHLCNVLQAA